MSPFPIMEDDCVKVSATLVHHGDTFPAFAFRFDSEYGSVTFSGDTSRTDNLVRLAHGSDIFVCEAINISGAKLPPAAHHHMVDAHIPVQHVGQFAQRCDAPRLVLSHIADLATTEINSAQWHTWAQHQYDGTVTVGSDLQQFSIKRK